jgi:hypothetical protein
MKELRPELIATYQGGWGGGGVNKWGLVGVRREGSSLGVGALSLGWLGMGGWRAKLCSLTTVNKGDAMSVCKKAVTEGWAYTALHQQWLHLCQHHSHMLAVLPAPCCVSQMQCWHAACLQVTCVCLRGMRSLWRRLSALEGGM